MLVVQNPLNYKRNLLGSVAALVRAEEWMTDGRQYRFRLNIFHVIARLSGLLLNLKAGFC